MVATVDRVPDKYFKHITDSTGLYEVRVEVGSDIYRVFCFFDKGQLIVPITASLKSQTKHLELKLNGQKDSKNNISMMKTTENMTSLININY